MQLIIQGDRTTHRRKGSKPPRLVSLLWGAKRSDVAAGRWLDDSAAKKTINAELGYCSELRVWNELRQMEVSDTDRQPCP